MEEKQKLYQEYFELIDSLQIDVNDDDYKVLDSHIRRLEQLDVVESSILSIFDLHKKHQAYISSKYKTYFGWDLDKASEGTDYQDSRTHPDDLIYLLKVGIYFTKLVLSKPVENRKDYKLITDYRMLGLNNQYIRIIEQQLCLETDKNGNIWLGLSVTDISPDHDITTPARCRALNFKTGEVFYYEENTNEKPEIHQLSKREKEVLQMVSEGLISKEIADKLFISVNTVNTHRQRIVEKLKVSNTFEAISFAKQLGLIN